MIDLFFPIGATRASHLLATPRDTVSLGTARRSRKLATENLLNSPVDLTTNVHLDHSLYSCARLCILTTLSICYICGTLQSCYSLVTHRHCHWFLHSIATKRMMLLVWWSTYGSHVKGWDHEHLHPSAKRKLVAPDQSCWPIAVVIVTCSLFFLFVCPLYEFFSSMCLCVSSLISLFPWAVVVGQYNSPRNQGYRHTAYVFYAFKLSLPSGWCMCHSSLPSLCFTLPHLASFTCILPLALGRDLFYLFERHTLAPSALLLLFPFAPRASSFSRFELG